MRPSNVLSRKKMIDVTTSVLMVDAYVQSRYYPDSTVRLLYESVFSQYGITREMYDSSLVWYGRNTEEFASVYEEIERNLSSHKDLLDTLYQDSVHEARIRYFFPEDLWDKQHRILIPRDDAYFAYRKLMSGVDSIASKDTIHWAMTLLPSMYEGEKIILSMALQDSETKKISYHRADTLRDLRGYTQVSMVLPDSLPRMYKMHFRLSYFRADSVRRTLPLLLDKVALYHRKYTLPEAIDSPDPISDTSTMAADTLESLSGDSGDSPDDIRLEVYEDATLD